MSRSEIYRLIKLGRFPQPVPLGARIVAWNESEIEEFVQGKLAARVAAPKPLEAAA